MANEKQAKFIIDVSAEKKRTRNSTVRFFSKDRQTAKLLIQAEKDKIAISKNLISRVEILLESVNASYIPDGKVVYNDLMAIESDGLFSYTLTDELLNYSGLMAFEIYIYYLSGEQSDSSNRIIYEQRVSAIDRNAGHVELVYLKDMEAAKREVALAAAETITNITGFYSGLDTYSEEKKDEMDAFSTSVGNLASAEKLKIQAELPTVQQTSTSETTKIKAELPKVQAVATAEIGKIKAVLPTVENAATEVSDYADQKIVEYDAKLEESNQSINTLSQNLSDLKAGMQLSDAYAWSSDGTDRFTKVYPGENLWLSSNPQFLKPNWTYSDDNKSFVYNMPNTAVATFYLGNVLKAAFPDDEGVGKTVTVSFDVESQLEGLQFSNGNMYINNSLIIPHNRPALIVGEKQRVFASFVYKKGSDASVVHIYITAPTSLVGKIVISDVKVEIGENTNPIYTPAPSEDPINAYPTYKGISIVDSDNPADYDWQYTDEYVDYLIANYNRTLLTQLNDLAGRVSALESK